MRGKRNVWFSHSAVSTSQQMDKISSIPHEYTPFQRRHRPHTHIWSGKVSQPFHQWSPSAVSNHSENKEKKQVLFLYIDIPSPSFPSRWLFLIPSLRSWAGRCWLFYKFSVYLFICPPLYWLITSISVASTLLCVDKQAI